MTEQTQAKEVMLIARRIVEFAKSELAGHSPHIQRAVLADLLAMWLADSAAYCSVGDFRHAPGADLDEKLHDCGARASARCPLLADDVEKVFWG